MGGIGRPDIVVIGNVHRAPNFLEGLCDFVDIGLRFHTGGDGFLFDLLAMFVRAGHESDLISHHSLVSGYRIRADIAIGMSDMNVAGSVVDRRRDVEIFLFLFHKHLTK